MGIVLIVTNRPPKAGAVCGRGEFYVRFHVKVRSRRLKLDWVPGRRAGAGDGRGERGRGEFYVRFSAWAGGRRRDRGAAGPVPAWSRFGRFGVRRWEVPSIGRSLSVLRWPCSSWPLRARSGGGMAAFAGSGPFDLDVAHVLDEVCDRGMVEVAAAVVHQRDEHLLRQAGERQAEFH